MHIRDKSPTQLEAQAATYLEYLERVNLRRYYELSMKIGDNAASLATLGVDAFLGDPQEYVAYLRSNLSFEPEAGTNVELSIRENIINHVALISAYHEFAHHVEAIKKDTSSKKVGEGCFATGYEFEHKGKTYIARLPIDPSDPLTMMQNHMAVGARLKHDPVKGCEVIVAGSYEHGAVIAEKVSGTQVPERQGSAFAPSKQHIHGLVNTIHELYIRNITAVNNADNYFYDPELGFTIIDCAMYEKDEKHPEDYLSIAAEIARFIADPDERHAFLETYITYTEDTYRHRLSATDFARRLLAKES